MDPRCSNPFLVANDADEEENRLSNIRSTNFSELDRPSAIPDEGNISIVEKMVKYD